MVNNYIIVNNSNNHNWLMVSTYPSEKWWSEFVSWDDYMYPIYYGNLWKIKAMFETTNQMMCDFRKM